MSLEWMIATMGNKNHTITVQRPVVTHDPSGGSSRAWANVTGSTNLPCSIQALSAFEKQMYAQRMIYISHKVYLAQDPKVLRGDRVLDQSSKYYITRGWYQEAGVDRLWVIEVREQPN